MTKRTRMHAGSTMLALATLMLLGTLVGCAQNVEGPDTDVDQPEDAQTQSMQEPIGIEEAEALTGLSADDEGVEYEQGEVLVLFWPENHVEDLEAALAQAPSVEEKRITEDMVDDGSMEGGVLHRDTLEGACVLVHTAEGATVVQAIAELERHDLVISASPIEIGVLDGHGTAGS